MRALRKFLRYGIPTLVALTYVTLLDVWDWLGQGYAGSALANNIITLIFLGSPLIFAISFMAQAAVIRKESERWLSSGAREDFYLAGISRSDLLWRLHKKEMVIKVWNIMGISLVFAFQRRFADDKFDPGAMTAMLVLFGIGSSALFSDALFAHISKGRKMTVLYSLFRILILPGMLIMMIIYGGWFFLMSAAPDWWGSIGKISISILLAPFVISLGCWAISIHQFFRDVYRFEP